MNIIFFFRFQQSRYPEIATPRSSVVSSSPQPIPGASPRHTPYSRTPVESVGSPEDYFVNSACNTMRSVSLHERLQQRSLEGLCVGMMQESIKY